MSKTSEKVSDAVKPVLSDAITEQAYAALVALSGFGWVFALPVISTVIRYMISSIADWAVKETAVGLSVLWIITDMWSEVSNAVEGRERLRKLLDSPQDFIEVEARKIEEEFDDETVELIQLSIARL